MNIAIELNGQPPLQVYVKPCREYKIILRSIDLGAMEVVTTYGEVRDFMQVGSPFSIPKAALVLAGFQPGFSTESYVSLEEQLKAFGSGMEITLLSAIPAGSGLGTSSILASTVLGAISDFCGLNWDKNEICNRTLILEQLLTTGGVARSIRRCASWSEIIADSCRYGSESVSALVARLFVYRWRISEVPFALLHGNYPYSQRNFS